MHAPYVCPLATSVVLCVVPCCLGGRRCGYACVTFCFLFRFASFECSPSCHLEDLLAPEQAALTSRGTSSLTTLQAAGKKDDVGHFFFSSPTGLHIRQYQGNTLGRGRCERLRLSRYFLCFIFLGPGGLTNSDVQVDLLLSLKQWSGRCPIESGYSQYSVAAWTLRHPLSVVSV